MFSYLHPLQSLIVGLCIGSFLNVVIYRLPNDLSVVKHISDRVGVMYQGQLVEIQETKKIFNTPDHDYTKELLRAIPQPDPKGRKKRKVERLKNQ